MEQNVNAGEYTIKVVEHSLFQGSRGMIAPVRCNGTMLLKNVMDNVPNLPLYRPLRINGESPCYLKTVEENSLPLDCEIKLFPNFRVGATSEWYFTEHICIQSPNGPLHTWREPEKLQCPCEKCVTSTQCIYLSNPPIIQAQNTLEIEMLHKHDNNATWCEERHKWVGTGYGMNQWSITSSNFRLLQFPRLEDITSCIRDLFAPKGVSMIIAEYVMPSDQSDMRNLAQVECVNELYPCGQVEFNCTSDLPTFRVCLRPRYRIATGRYMISINNPINSEYINSAGMGNWKGAILLAFIVE